MIDDWLRYHLDLLGIDHAELYDVDGSFGDVAAAHWLERSPRWHDPEAEVGRNGQGTLTYRRAFPANLSRNLADISKQHPYCTEMFAYSDCLVRHRALSRWVLILHAPDEYAISPLLQRGGNGTLQWVLDKIEETLPLDEPIGMALVEAASFAQGSAGAEQGQEVHSSRAQPGHVLAASQKRSNIWYQHSPLLDPSQCGAAGAHTCYAEKAAEYRPLMSWVDTQLLRVHHYVEMLGRNRGRCAGQHKSCDVADTTAVWLIPYL